MRIFQILATARDILKLKFQFTQTHKEGARHSRRALPVLDLVLLPRWFVQIADYEIPHDDRRSIDGFNQSQEFLVVVALSGAV